jgi:hypothetical protein
VEQDVNRPRTLREGQQVGEWTLLQFIPAQREGRRRTQKSRWLARCSCGLERDVLNDHLVAGTTHSCGHSTKTRRQPVSLAGHVRQLVRLYGDLSAAARGLDIEPADLSQLQSGEKTDPDDEILQKLGLQRAVVYVRAAPGEPLRRNDRQRVNSVFALGAQ